MDLPAALAHQDLQVPKETMDWTVCLDLEDHWEKRATKVSLAGLEKLENVVLTESPVNLVGHAAGKKLMPVVH